MAVTENQIAKCVNYYRRLLDARAGRPDSLAQATRSRLQQVIQRAGAKRRSVGLLTDLEEAFSDAGIVTYPRLTDRKIRADERIYFFDRRHEPKDLVLTRQSFPSERMLRDYLQANLHEFEELRGLTQIQREKRMPSGRRLDLIGRRSRLNELVGIELKLGDINDRAVGQSMQYIDDIAKEAGKQGLSARFVLLAGGQANNAARQRIQRHADTCEVSLSILLYTVEMTIRPHP